MQISVVRLLKVFWNYSPNDINVYMVQRGGEFEEIWPMYRTAGLKVVKSRSRGNFVLFICRMYYLATVHNVTDRQAERQTDSRTTVWFQYNQFITHKSVQYDQIKKNYGQCLAVRFLSFLHFCGSLAPTIITPKLVVGCGCRTDSSRMSAGWYVDQ